MRADTDFSEPVAFTLRAVGQETFEDVIVPDDKNSAEMIQAANRSQAVTAKIPTSQVNRMRS